MEWGICGLVIKMKNAKDIKHNYYITFSVIYFLLSISCLLLINHQTNNIVNKYPGAINDIMKIKFLSLIFISFIFFISLYFVYKVRKDIVNFSENIIYNIDQFISGNKNMKFDLNKDDLLSKVQNKLKYMIEVMEDKNEKYLQEKESIKTLISDISHQIKTPIANISMYNETLICREIDKENQILFLKNMQLQVNKLEWLVKSLIKMSRLENGIINLNMIKSRITDTILNALSSIHLKAEEKNISIELDIDEKLELYHDKKWTTEAFFNIIENAVKYTDKGGHINISMVKMDFFTRVTISDNGIGINENEINHIFKRFYRSPEVNAIEGVGIGLYLVRKIINKQGGYIKVESQMDIGTKFNIYLKN